MMAEPADMILPLLREMRAENADLHERTRSLIAALEQKVRELESQK